MDYFSILNLNREPFSNSPDPDYFYHSSQHLDCLQKLELSLHLRRGLNVIIGDVGTGKTTLCRQIIRRFANRKDMETHLVLDPLFRDPADFLAAIAKLLSGRKLPEGATDWQAKEFIKHTLFRKGVDQKRTTILIIDEGQKIPVFCLELLREFLNYETNDYKLLQIVIFAQKEFEGVVRSHPNFGDRINLYHHLKPLSLRDTRLMIQFRLEKSSSAPQKLDLFTLPGLIAVHRTTGGYPRKIINLCHQCILAMIIQNQSKVGYWLVRRSATRVFPATGARSASAAGAGAGGGRGARRAPDLGDGNGCRPAPGLERPGVPRDRAGDRGGRKAHRGAAGTRGVPTACGPGSPGALPGLSAGACGPGRNCAHAGRVRQAGRRDARTRPGRSPGRGRAAGACLAGGQGGPDARDARRADPATPRDDFRPDPADLRQLLGPQLPVDHSRQPADRRPGPGRGRADHPDPRHPRRRKTSRWP